MGAAGPFPDRHSRHACAFTLSSPSDRPSEEAHEHFAAEACWGSDPLEYLGGFHTLLFDDQAEFKSSLAANGLVKWSKFAAASHRQDRGGASIDLEIAFSTVDWPFLQSVYGWAALQCQAWTRGYIDVGADDRQTCVLYTDGVLEFWVDDEHFFGGDFYSFRRAPPVISLEPGRHRIDVRLTRDVRAMGAVGDPTIRIKLSLQAQGTILSAAGDGIISSDIIAGNPASPLASVPLRNNTDDAVIIIDRVQELTGSFAVSPLCSDRFCLMPGQTRPFPFQITPVKLKQEPMFTVVITYHLQGSEQLRTIEFTNSMKQRSATDAHKVTFLHPGGTVSYAILRPPPQPFPGDELPMDLPMLICLHGAGVEADSELVRHSLDAVADVPAWTLFPTGSTPWCGDDWHQWGWQDVEAAIAAIPEWINRHKWSFGGVDTNKRLIAGHSNGGQGVWFALTHWPDLVLAAAPVSGYSSIQSYVPYQLWQEHDPRLTSVLHAALSSYRHELLAPNAKGIPILQQHGRADDNVPAFHSRRMSQLLRQAHWRSEYYELPNKGHWFDGVMTTPQLQQFFRKHLASNTKPSPAPRHFTLVVANPADHGPKHGFQITQLIDPGQLGTLERSPSSSKHFLTSNVRRLIVPRSSQDGEQLCIDGCFPLNHQTQKATEVELRRDNSGAWEVLPAIGLVERGERYGKQLGHLDAILKSRGRFRIFNSCARAAQVSLQISRNLMQYFNADAEITTPPATTSDMKGSMITVGVGNSIPRGTNKEHPITLESGRLAIVDYDGKRRIYRPRTGGLGAIFLRPGFAENLDLVVWGVEEQSLEVAARLVPMMAGAGQPDFVIVTRECLWKGLGGVLAMGFFDSFWGVTRSSYLA